jgi:flagellar motor switch protein FliN/FliY
MLDNQFTDTLTEAQQAIDSLLSPAEAPRSIRKYQLRDLSDADGPAQATSKDLDSSGDAPIELQIELGRARISLDEAGKLCSGSLVRLDKLTGECVDLYAAGRLVGRGEVLIVDGRIGVRMVELARS